MTKTISYILAGGRVEELGVLTFRRPKCMVPFGGIYRFIDFALTSLVTSGIGHIGILVQYNPMEVIQHIGSGESWDLLGKNRCIKILPPYISEKGFEWYKGTADAVYQNLRFLYDHKPDNVLIVSGDHVHNMNYRMLIKFHEEKNADVTIGFVKVPVEQSSRFGVGIMDSEQRLVEYYEKVPEPKSSYASLTIYYFRREILEDALHENARLESHEFGRDIIPWLLQKKFNVYGYIYNGYWGYCRTIDEYMAASMELLNEECDIKLRDWNIRTNLEQKLNYDRPPAYTSSTAIVENTQLSRGCKILGTVKNSILSPGVLVEKAAVVENSILFHDVHVGKNALLYRVIADENIVFGENVSIGDETSITVVGIPK